MLALSQITETVAAMRKQLHDPVIYIDFDVALYLQEEARDALDAGAVFVVTPVVQPEVIATCSNHGAVSMGAAFTLQPKEAYEPGP